MLEEHLNEEHRIALALDELETSARVAAEAHVAGCATCRAEIQLLRSLLDHEQQAARIEMPATPGLVSLLAHQARRTSKLRLPQLLPRQPILATAAVAVAALFFTVGYVQGRQATRTPATLSPASAKRAPLPPPPAIDFVASAGSELAAGWGSGRLDTAATFGIVDSL